MILGDWLHSATARLTDAGIATARLDCSVLLSDQLGHDRAWVLSHPDYELQGSELEKLNTKIVQRCQHVPLAYIRGHAEFYGRDFAVNEHTLVPRPETESLIELLKRIRNREADVLAWLLADIGTGSGAIAITAALELPGSTVWAADIDEQCLETARANAAQLQAIVTLYHGNLLEAVPDLPADKTTILLCNLPYVPDDFKINTAATHEPRHALFGGADGLDLYRELFRQIIARAVQPRHILAESLPPQHEALAAIAKAAGYALRETDDFIQHFETESD